MSLLSVQQFTELATAHRRVIVVTGAGVSVPSGIPDFATTDATWREPITRAEALSVDYFQSNYQDFWRIYRQLFLSKTAGNAQPSKAHLYLKQLEEVAEVSIYTQNVDGLHQAAGSSYVVELHGNASTVTCVECSSTHPSNISSSPDPTCPTCGGKLKPNIVLYGEGSPGYSLLGNALAGPGMVLYMGTSLTVAPISMLPMQVSMYQQHLWQVYWDKTATRGIEAYVDHYMDTDFTTL